MSHGCDLWPQDTYARFDQQEMQVVNQSPHPIVTGRMNPPLGEPMSTYLKSELFDLSVSNRLPEEKLVTTPTLSKVSCVFNTRYHGIICQSCKAMVPLSRLHKHVTTPLQSSKVPKSQLVAGMESSYTSHITHGITIGIPKARFKSMILEELASILNIGHVRDVDEHIMRCDP